MNSLEKRIREWMVEVLDEKGWSCEKWAQNASISPTTITRFLGDQRATVPSTRTLAKLAIVAGSEPPLMGKATSVRKMRDVPVLTVAQVIERVRNVKTKAEAVHRTVKSPENSISENAFAVEVTNEDLLLRGGIEMGDILIVEPNLEPVQGNPVLVLCQDERLVIGFFNPPYFIPNMQAKLTPVLIENAEIIGVVVQFVRSLL